MSTFLFLIVIIKSYLLPAQVVFVKFLKLHEQFKSLRINLKFY
jgi:hypothetical protein